MPPVHLSREQASRLLSQAAFGGTAAEIDQVRTLGIEGWLARQFGLPRSPSRVDWMRANGYEQPLPNTGNPDRAGAERANWQHLIASPDVLRQRVTLALSEILVISLAGVRLPYRGFASAAFIDLLEAHAFGNYRELLLQVSRSPAMGAYLSFRNNRKANGSGSSPDENYARELMQLFSIGLQQLHPDGTPVLANGVPQPTYTQADVTQLARVFTGWQLDPAEPVNPADRVIRPMVSNPRQHETGASTFLGVTVPAGNSGESSLQITVDTLMQHPSIGPFIGRQLIQRLVKSHPSPAYVQRVAAAFDGHAGRPKGDLPATISAVLTDPEARSAAGLSDPAHGKLREPMLRFVQWARTFGLDSPDGQWRIGNLSDPSRALAQSPLRSPSVFNFFRPGYVPPAPVLASAGLTAPEFQITSETSVAAYLNFMQRTISRGIGGMVADYGALRPLAGDAGALLAELNLLLAAGQIGADTLARLHAAVLLVMAAPEYLVQK